MKGRINKFEFLNTLWYLNKKGTISLSLLGEILSSEGFNVDNLDIDENGYTFYSKDLKTKYEKNRRL